MEGLGPERLMGSVQRNLGSDSGGLGYRIVAARAEYCRYGRYVGIKIRSDIGLGTKCAAFLNISSGQRHVER